MILIVALIKEDFKENNFIYTGSKELTQVTIFENNYAFGTEPSSYEATLVYLIRCRGILKIFTESHTLGLFSFDTWNSLLEGSGFKVKQIMLKHCYESSLHKKGNYNLRVFLCEKL